MSNVLTPTPARRGLDVLLAHYPGFDLLALDWQTEYVGSRVEVHGPWLLVELGQRSADAAEVWARHRFAIWKSTGAVHSMSHDGAVSDDPLFEASGVQR